MKFRNKFLIKKKHFYQQNFIQMIFLLWAEIFGADCNPFNRCYGNGATVRNPFLRNFKTYLQKHVSGGPKELALAVGGGPGLAMFILGRFVAVSCLRNQIQNLDPTNGLALGAIF